MSASLILFFVKTAEKHELSVFAKIERTGGIPAESPVRFFSLVEAVRTL